MNKQEITIQVKEKSKELGFDLVGITKPHIIKNKLLDVWLSKNNHASMQWIKNRSEERKNIYSYFPEIKSVISFGYNYYTGENNLDNKDFKISNYAWGNDYHIVLKNKLKSIIKILQEHYPKLKYRICVDTSPLLEKYWAQKAGLGWIGKHTNLINNKIGSWFFLSEILINKELDYDSPFIEDLCGTCTKCIDACPTDAINDYVLDSNKCISYLTIEHRGSISEELEDKLDNWIYGCDICQQVCPWNIKFSHLTNDMNFKKRSDIENMNNEKWIKMNEEGYRKIFKDSAIKRTKYVGLKRNINVNNKK